MTVDLVTVVPILVFVVLFCLLGYVFLAIKGFGPGSRSDNIFMILYLIFIPSICSGLAWILMRGLASIFGG